MSSAWLTSSGWVRFFSLNDGRPLDPGHRRDRREQPARAPCAPAGPTGGTGPRAPGRGPAPAGPSAISCVLRRMQLAVVGARSARGSRRCSRSRRACPASRCSCGTRPGSCPTCGRPGRLHAGEDAAAPRPACGAADGHGGRRRGGSAVHRRGESSRPARRATGSPAAATAYNRRDGAQRPAARAAARRPARAGHGRHGRSPRSCWTPTWRAGVAARGHRAARRSSRSACATRTRPRGIDAARPRVRRTDDLAATSWSIRTSTSSSRCIGGTDAGGRAGRAPALDAGQGAWSPPTRRCWRGTGAALEARARERRAWRCASRRPSAGGIPVLGAAGPDLAANRIDAVRGIVNGTTNHILTRDGRRMAATTRTCSTRPRSAATRRPTRAATSRATTRPTSWRSWRGSPSARWPDVRRDAPRAPADARAMRPPGITGVEPRELERCGRAGPDHQARRARGARRATAASAPAVDARRRCRATSPLGATGGVTNLVEVVGDAGRARGVPGPGAGGPADGSAGPGGPAGDRARATAPTWGPLPPAGRAVARHRRPRRRASLVLRAPRDARGGPHARRRIDATSPWSASDEALVTRPMRARARSARGSPTLGVDVHALPRASPEA